MERSNRRAASSVANIVSVNFFVMLLTVPINTSHEYGIDRV